jgi:hypothetical protein
MSSKLGGRNARFAILAAAVVVLAALAIAYYMLAMRPPAETVTPPTAPAKPGVFKEATDGSFQPFGPPPVQPPKDYTGPLTSVSFATPMHDFGDVMQNSVHHYSFAFTNTGLQPLVITTAIGSCGCTAPEYPKEPIPPGGRGEISVVYRPGTQEGYQLKTISVKCNTDPSPVVLRIAADVQKEK